VLNEEETYFLITGKAFTPFWCNHLTLEYTQSSEGLYRINKTLDGDWYADLIWSAYSVPNRPNRWNRPFSPFIGTSSEGKERFILFKNRWQDHDFTTPSNVTLDNHEVIILPADPPFVENDNSPELTICSAQNIYVGQLDSDMNSEILFFGKEGVFIFGMKDTERYEKRNTRCCSGTKLQEARGIAAKHTIKMAHQMTQNSSYLSFDTAVSAFKEFVKADCLHLADDILYSLELDDSEYQGVLGSIKGDLFLLKGEYSQAEIEFSSVRGSRPFSILQNEKLQHIKIRQNLAQSLERKWTDQFNSDLSTIFDFKLNNGVGFNLDHNPQKIIGTNFYEGPYLLLEGISSAKPDIDKRSLPDELMAIDSTSAVWNAKEPFRLSYLVYFSRLDYATSFDIFMLPVGEIRAINRDVIDKSFLVFRMCHHRMSSILEGDRYGVELTSGTAKDKRAGSLLNEFHLGQWYKVVIEYIPIMSLARVTLDIANRHPDDSRILMLYLQDIKPPAEGDYRLDFRLFRVRSEASEGNPYKAVILVGDLKFETHQSLD
jgi:hypothetical protein